jgi:hypothetical protein
VTKRDKPRQNPQFADFSTFQTERDRRVNGRRLALALLEELRAAREAERGET